MDGFTLTPLEIVISNGVETVDWFKPRSRVTNRLAQEVYRLTAKNTGVKSLHFTNWDGLCKMEP